MKHRRLLAISSLFLAATVSASVAGRAAANTEVDAGTAFSRLKVGRRLGCREQQQQRSQ
jgi:hypothetical protein